MYFQVPQIDTSSWTWSMYVCVVILRLPGMCFSSLRFGSFLGARLPVAIVRPPLLLRVFACYFEVFIKRTCAVILEIPSCAYLHVWSLLDPLTVCSLLPNALPTCCLQ